MNRSLPFIFLFSLLLASFSMSQAQGLDETYSGCWAMTWWKFEFKEDGTWKRNSTGHYGVTEVTGTYVRKGDTLHLTTGYEGTHKTVNEYYLIDEDGKLVDLHLGYDYAPVPDSDPHMIYNSRERWDIVKKEND